MIYDDLSFTVTTNPRHPGAFRIVAYPPIGFRFEANHRTGTLDIHPDEPDTDAAQRRAGVYLPTPGTIARHVEKFRAAQLADHVAHGRPVANREGGRVARVSGMAGEKWEVAGLEGMTGKGEGY